MIYYQPKYYSFFILLFFLSIVNGFAQENNHLIEGKVIDEEGKPIAGANVFIENQCFPTVVDISGEFRLIIPGNYTEDLYAMMIGYLISKVKIETNQDYYEITLVEEPFFQPDFTLFLGMGITQLSENFRYQNIAFTSGIEMKHALWRSLGVRSGIHYNYFKTSVENQLFSLHSFAVPLLLEFDFLRYSPIGISAKAGGFVGFYPFATKNILIQQKWNYGWVTGFTTSYKGFSINLDAYFGVNDLKINYLKTQNTTYTATLGLDFYKLKRLFKK